MEYTIYATIYDPQNRTLAKGVYTTQAEALAFFSKHKIHPLLIQSVESDNGHEVDYYYQEEAV